MALLKVNGLPHYLGSTGHVDRQIHVQEPFTRLVIDFYRPCQAICWIDGGERKAK